MMTVNSMDTAYSESQELLSELRVFIAGATKSSKTNASELTKTALSLLNTLPAARDAVLEYFCSIFHFTVVKYLTAVQTKKMEELKSDEEFNMNQMFIIELQDTLCNFVTSNADAWAPIISVWSLDLLGQISASNASAHKNLSLNDRLQLWMGCQPARTLIEINTQCLQCLMHSNTDACINALLDKSIQYTPHFDWVVAHVGSCFPRTVINKVLYCGLKDFCKNEINTFKAPKLNSVVGILSHLANTHFNDVKLASYHLFLGCLEEDIEMNEIEDKNIATQRIATVPFLIHICALSPILLKALSDKTLSSLNIDSIMRMSHLATSWWCYFEGGRKILFDTTIHLILQLETNILDVIDLILDVATLSDPQIPNVTQTAQELVELLFSEIDYRLRTMDCVAQLIRCLPSDLGSLCDILDTCNEFKLNYLTNMFLILGKYNSNLLSAGVSHLLTCAKDEIHFKSLLEMINGLNDVEYIGQSLMLALYDIELEKASPLILWENVYKILMWEQKFNDVRKPVLHGLMDNFEQVINNLRSYYYDLNISTVIVNLIYQLLLIGDRNLSVHEVVTLTEISVKFFFCCVIADVDNSEKLKYCQMSNKLLSKLCTGYYSSVARMFALRLIVQTTLFPPVSPMFGATLETDSSLQQSSQHSLSEDNITRGHLLMVTSSLHAGVISNKSRKTVLQMELSKDQIKTNTRHLINFIRSCCLTDVIPLGQAAPQQPIIAIEAVINLALILVHTVSPDIMYNGLPWPDEDFCKVTLERDLCIRHTFDQTPIIWDILKFISLHRPALCYCSVLLRAVTATVICHWNSVSQGRKICITLDQLTNTTLDLLDLMTLGQLVPPPLNSLRDVIPYLEPGHISLVLRECIWNYMKDHVPAPALFSRDGNGVMWRDPSTALPGKQYTEALRIVMLQKIEILSSLYNKLFLSDRKQVE